MGHTTNPTHAHANRSHAPMSERPGTLRSMFLVDGAPVWSASDLTDAAECEYAVLRRLDYRLGWAEPIEEPDDPLMKRIALLGDRHEQRVLESLEERGAHLLDLSQLPSRAWISARQRPMRPSWH